MGQPKAASADEAAADDAPAGGTGFPGGEPHQPSCRNCGAPLPGPYCSACGQRDLDLQRPFGELVSEWLGAVVAFDSRLLRTLWPLVTRPGFLTREFFAGRRVRYVDPVKLYLAVSLVLFVALRLTGATLVRTSTDDRVVAPITIRTSESGGATDGSSAGEASATSASAPSPVADGEAARSGSLLGRGLRRLFELYERDPAAFNRLFLDRLAKTVFVLLPVVALLLRLLYRRTRYVHQLVFALHLQTLVFVAMLMRLGLDAVGVGPIGDLLLLVGVPTWLFLALRTQSGEGKVRTVLKTAALLSASLVSLVATLLVTLAVATLTG